MEELEHATPRLGITGTFLDHVGFLLTSRVYTEGRSTENGGAENLSGIGVFKGCLIGQKCREIIFMQGGCGRDQNVLSVPSVAQPLYPMCPEGHFLFTSSNANRE